MIKEILGARQQGLSTFVENNVSLYSTLKINSVSRQRTLNQLLLFNEPIFNTHLFIYNNKFSHVTLIKLFFFLSAGYYTFIKLTRYSYYNSIRVWSSMQKIYCKEYFFKNYFRLQNSRVA